MENDNPFFVGKDSMTLGELLRGYFSRLPLDTPIVVRDENRTGYGTLCIEEIIDKNGRTIIVLLTP